MDFIVFILVTFNIAILPVGFLFYKIEFSVLTIMFLKLIGPYFIYKI